MVNWIDKKDNNDKIVQTEFILTDKTKEILEDDNFIYKIIVYLTTGKIMIQGKHWENFCDNKFEECKSLVSQLSSVQNSSEDRSKQTTKSSVNTVSIMSDSNTYHEHIQPENNYSDDQTVLKTCEPVTQHETTELSQESISKNSKTDDNNNMNIKSMLKNNLVEGDHSTPKVLSLDNEPNQQKSAMDPIKMLDNRLDILEESMVKMTSLLTSTATLQNQHKREITFEIQKLAISKNSTPVCQDFQAQEKLLLDKNTQINKLSKTIDQMQINKETELKQLKQESEKCTVHLKEQINELRKEKINCEMENEKLTFINEQNLKESLNLKSDFEERIQEKDCMIKNLQDRIQSFLYDKNGEPWGKVNQKPKEMSSKLDTTGDNENNLFTEELNNLQPEASNQDDLQVKSPETTRPTDTCDITFRDNDSDLKFPSKEASESQSVASQKLPQVNKKSGNDNAKAVNFDFLFLHDSICNFIDIRKLLSGSVYEGIKHTSYTVEKTREFISSLQHARTLLLHVGINNLKKESADAVVRKFVLMVDEVLKKVGTVIISLVVPTKYSELNEKIKNFNNQLYNHLYYADNIHFCSHDNFSHHGQVLPHLYQDCFRLSRDQGIRVLASNIRNILFPRSSRRSVNNHNRSTKQYYQSQNKDKYVRSEAIGNHQNYSYNERNTNWSFHEPVQAQLTEDHKYNSYGNSHSIQGRDGRQSSESHYTEDHKRHESNQRINDLASTIASAVAGAFRDFV
ncbi:Hypothetical predicted protein [Mytilus galloprovincialis]|uniref:Uncharacterized protein n=1 Tax=Mytilus galloprovincialis TaxID=29158 RepID=A0A8B6G1W9_MYTGA|nr:Hypothetical predicted protein [Mytilus galloprovincialis]